ncbi:hypothetical protein PoB_007321000 [Plakobranchus ocellatus]|uniref:Uncharacterized protein n=1 Tax=Plakobranchus ocellatus TaxID=259542 RepID=A0AAV4DRD2_9GAST|nr:hypothetical protein PoB_007321000 [Plakobranchus ocellatus]
MRLPREANFKVETKQTEKHNRKNGEVSLQQGDLKLSGAPSGQGACGESRTSHRRIPEDLRADLLSTVPLTPLHEYIKQI